MLKPIPRELFQLENVSDSSHYTLEKTSSVFVGLDKSFITGADQSEKYLPVPFYSKCQVNFTLSH